MTDRNQPTVFHVTHWKAGSQWAYAVLQACAPERIVKPKVKVAHFYEDAILPGKIYPTVYAPRNRFEATLWPGDGASGAVQPPSSNDPAAAQNHYNFEVLKQPAKVFVVIRDLRDALVSLYFSLKVSHPLISENVAEGHRKLNEMKTEEDGLLYIIDERGKASANIQSSWLPARQSGDVLFLRYEDLIANEQQEFSKIIEYCQINISAKKLTEIVNNNSFNKRAGRNPGDEDVSSHFRKGVSGDWKNHFTDRIKTEFKQKFGQLLIDTGYEKDMNW
jgi:lipopolysaccharide transport system ATP-binding protein